MNRWIGMAALGMLGATGVSAAPTDAERADALYQQAQNATEAVQSRYTGGVPHTDRRGNVRTGYDPAQSFFPIAMWGVPMHREGGEYDWKQLQSLHINTIWPYASITPGREVLELADRFGFQVIFMHEIPEDVLREVKDHPRLLGNVWRDEPIGQLEVPGKMDELWSRYNAYRERVKAIAPEMAVFINDAPWIMPPATEWFVRWNTAGDIACQDNYPVKVSSSNLKSLAEAPNGIAQSVALTALANREAKPVWLIVGAFEQGYPLPGQKDTFPYRYPTPEQLRGQVYTGIIHGATGIHYFIWDSYISRAGSVFGISPNPREQPEGLLADSPARQMNAVQRANARALWDTVAAVNAELVELTPSLLSPTVRPAELFYTVGAHPIAGEAETPNPIRTLLKPVPGEPDTYLLLTVNVDAAAIDATFRFDRAPKTAEVLFASNQHAPVIDGEQVELHYEPFVAQVVKLSF